MKNYILFFAILISNQLLFAQNEKFIPAKKVQKSFSKLDFSSIQLPNNDPNMGFTGIHYNMFVNDWAYAGIGFHSAVSGNRGGFFTLGVNAGIKKYFSKNAFVDAGIHYGGGGGAKAPDGGGAFILPHVNLGYSFKKISVSAGLSYINFFDKGNIKSQQLNFSIEVPLSFDYADHSTLDREINIYFLKKTEWDKKSSRFSVMLHLNNLKIKGNSKDTDGNKYQGETIRLAGIEVASFLNNNLFAFVKIDGAYKGIKAGYMDLFLGAGYVFSFNKKQTNIVTKFGVGAGGGGGVDTKGGFLIYPDLSIEQKIFDGMFISVNTGFLMSPDAYFNTSSLGFGLKYYIDKNGTTATNKTFKEAKLKGFEFIIKQDMYFNVQRESGFVTSPKNATPAENLHQISLQINLNLDQHFYLAGQTSFANFGNAGSYTEVIAGLGIQTAPLFRKTTTIFAQILGGGAGGGNISATEGFIVKPSLGLNYKLNNSLSIRSALGYVKAEGGELSSPFVNLGLKYNFSLLKMK